MVDIQMEQSFYYTTLVQEGFAEYKDRGSRFIAYAFPIESVEQFKKRLNGLKEEHPKAVHHCFAYRLGTDGNQFRASDDGEPSGSAGRPILGQIDSKGLVNIAIVVVRYFGGTLLGVPGLINAYKTVSSLALQTVQQVQRPIEKSFRLTFDYTILNDVMTVLKKYNCSIIKQEMQLFCSVDAGIPLGRMDEVRYPLEQMYGLEIQPI